MKNTIQNRLNKTDLLAVLLFTVLGAINLPVLAAEGDHHHGHGHDTHTEQKAENKNHGHHHDHAAGNDAHEESGAVTLSPEQMALADIEVSFLKARTMDYQVYAPGEIKANGYTSYIVSPRVASVVVRRHATLGQHIKAGQPLVTLFSEEVAEAQGTYLSSRAEWLRVSKLGRRAVGEKRFLNAKTTFETARARLFAFGMTGQSVKALSTESVRNPGEYTLTAAIDGAVLSDDFRQGQSISAGGELMTLADETELWIEARLPANSVLPLHRGQQALVKVAEDTYSAEVTQEAHTIDPATRTRVIRLLIDNRAHRLHSGMFADVYFQFKTRAPVLAVPESALMRSADGDWTVFVEGHPGEFVAQEVSLGRSLGQWREVQGLDAGTRFVSRGAFFVASQIAKGGFDPHNH